MTELLKNAWIGWHDFTDAGKLAALLLISLLFLWIYYKKTTPKSLLIYATAAAACCIFPVTAALLMLYQTRFYDYQWVWSIVPMTAVTAFAAAVFVTDFLKAYTKGNRPKAAGAVVLLLAAIVLSSGMGTKPWDSQQEQAERKAAEELMAEIEERIPEKEIYLWAPREIMEYARSYDAGIRLLYGRNMWDPALNAYSYDTYSQELLDMEQWMRGEGENGLMSDEDCAKLAALTDVNCIVLPKTAGEETITCFEETLGAAPELVGDYYLLIR